MVFLGPSKAMTWFYLHNYSDHAGDKFCFPSHCVAADTDREIRSETHFIVMYEEAT
jgi:hypothetical protein